MNVERPDTPERTTRRFWLFDNRLSILADHGDTEGRYDLVEGLVPAGFETSLHRHTRYAEHFFVLEGEITAWVEGRTAVLGAGESVLVPMGAAHVISVSGQGPARTLVVASPSGFARLVSKAGIADADGYFDDAGFPVGGSWDEVGLPEVGDPHAYALEISGESMEPVYRDGDIVVVSPAA